MAGRQAWPADFEDEKACATASAIHDRAAAAGLWNPAQVELRQAPTLASSCREQRGNFHFGIIRGGAPVSGPILRVVFHRNGEFRLVYLADFDVTEVERAPVVLDAAAAAKWVRRLGADRTGYYEGWPRPDRGRAGWSRHTDGTVELTWHAEAASYYRLHEPSSVSMIRPKVPLRPLAPG